MKFLNDTCVFIKKINSPQILLNVIEYQNKKYDEFQVTNHIIDELDRMASINDEKGKIARNIMNNLKIHDSKDNISIIDVDNNVKYKNNFEDIRTRYYGHLVDRKILKELVDSGKYTKDQAKSLWKKDIGECSCVAVAMEEPDRHVIVSEDGGKITLKPETNIFKIFEKSHKIKVWSFDTWSNETRYSSSKDIKKVRMR